MQPDMAYFYPLACVTGVLFLAGVAGHVKFWLSSVIRSGQPPTLKAKVVFLWRSLGVPAISRRAHYRLVRDALLQLPLLHRKGWPSWIIHMAMMWATIWLFVVGSIGDMLAERGLLDVHKDDPWFGFSNDLAGAVLVIAIIAIIYRRYLRPSPLRAMLTRAEDGLLTFGLLAVTVSGFMVEATRYLAQRTPEGEMHFAFIGGYLVDAVAFTSLSWDVLHLSVWWVHAIGALALIGYIPFSQLSHLFAAPAHALLADSQDRRADSGQRFNSPPVGFSMLQLMALDACTRCGECMRWCEAFLTRRRLDLAPPQKLRFFRSLLTGALTPGTAVERVVDETGTGNAALRDAADGVFQCTLCGRCAVVCPVKLNLRDLYLSMRAALVAGHLYPSNLDLAKLAVASEHNVVNYPNDERATWVEYLPDAPDDCYQRPMAAVVYFVGCMSSFSPAIQSIPAAFAKVLSAANVDFSIMGPDEWCCGFPLLAAGMSDAADEVRRHNLAMVRDRGARVITFTCPSCYHTWRNHYAADLPGVELLHSTQLIERLLREAKLTLRPLDTSVTYHDPCDLGRNSGVYESPRSVLRAVPNVTLREIVKNRDRSHCCGGGGNLEITDPALSASVAALTVNAFEATGAQILVTACQQCKRVLRTAALGQQSALEVLDITELIASALR